VEFDSPRGKIYVNLDKVSHARKPMEVADDYAAIYFDDEYYVVVMEPVAKVARKLER
jgi:hypothetical protein